MPPVIVELICRLKRGLTDVKKAADAAFLYERPVTR